MKKEMTASELLGSSKPKNEPVEEKEEKTEEPVEETTDEQTQKTNNENNDKENNADEEESGKLRKLKTDKKIKKESISDKEMDKIESKMNEKAQFMAKAINGHDNIVKAKENEEKEIEEYKKSKKQREKNTKSSPLNIDDVSVKRGKKKRGGKLSKLEKIKDMTKKGKSAELPLFASNYMIKMYGMNTWINLDNYFDTFFKEFGYFQNINKLKMIYENSEFLFKDGDKVDFETFLNITSPDDITLIYALWSVVNNDGEPVTIPAQCEHCGETHEREVTPKEILKSSFTDEQRLRFKDYDSTKTINELQEDIIMGEKVTIIHEENGVRFKAILSSPNLKRYFYVDSQMRSYIVDELNEYLPSRLRSANDDTDKLRYLYQQKRPDINTMYNRYTEHLLYTESIKLTDIEGDESFTITLEDDGAVDFIETIKATPDEMMKKLIEETQNMAEQEDIVNLQGEPFRCSNCKKITSMEDIPVGDILFFTIQKMHQKKSLKKKQN